MSDRPTVKALHESLRDDPMALVMGPAIQAGLCLAARLDTSHHDFWEQMKGELLDLASSVEGLDEAEVEVMNHLIGIFETQKGESNGGSSSKRVRTADREVGARGDVQS